MKSAVLLYNPQSGRGKIDFRVEEICTVFRAYGYDIRPQQIDFAANPFDGNETLSLMVVAGGDGTLNFALNAMKRKGLDIPFGVIPAGTANDFAGALGMSRHPLEAARQIAQGVEERVDCGCVNGLYFVNVFSCGLFTDVSQKTPTAWKNNLGKIAYYINGIGDLPRFRSMDLSIRTDGGDFDGKAVIFFVFNGRTAGTLPIAYQSEGDDGLLDVLILKGDSPLTPLRTAMRYLPNIVLRKGYPSGIVHIKCSHLHALSTRDEHTDMDGQPGPSFPIDIRCAHNALRVIVPPNAMQRALWTETLPTLPGRNGAKQ